MMLPTLGFYIFILLYGKTRLQSNKELNNLNVCMYNPALKFIATRFNFPLQTIQSMLLVFTTNGKETRFKLWSSRNYEIFLSSQ